jgi:translation elongation factor 2 (EF-2/EF-G)
MVDPHVGTLSYFRIYSGTLKSGITVLNTSNGETYRIGRIARMHANHREEVEEMFAGDIGAIVGGKDLKQEILFVILNTLLCLKKYNLLNLWFG